MFLINRVSWHLGFHMSTRIECIEILRHPDSQLKLAYQTVKLFKLITGQNGNYSHKLNRSNLSASKSKDIIKARIPSKSSTSMIQCRILLEEPMKNPLVIPRWRSLGEWLKFPYLCIIMYKEPCTHSNVHSAPRQCALILISDKMKWIVGYTISEYKYHVILLKRYVFPEAIIHGWITRLIFTFHLFRPIVQWNIFALKICTILHDP